MILLDWTSKGPEGTGYVADRALPCIHCKVPTILRNPHREPCHKVCAEADLARAAIRHANRPQEHAA